MAENFIISVLVLNQVGAVIDDKNVLPIEKYLGYKSINKLVWSRWVKARYYVTRSSASPTQTLDTSSRQDGPGKYKREILQGYNFSGPVNISRQEQIKESNSEQFVTKKCEIYKQAFKIGACGVSSVGETIHCLVDI